MEAAAGSRLVERTADLELVTLELLAAMQTGRPRPVTLEVPIDVLAGTATVEPAAMPDLRPYLARVADGCPLTPVLDTKVEGVVL